LKRDGWQRRKEINPEEAKLDVQNEVKKRGRRRSGRCMSAERTVSMILKKDDAEGKVALPLSCSGDCYFSPFHRCHCQYCDFLVLTEITTEEKQAAQEADGRAVCAPVLN
jgi:hypothetical protein